MNNGIKVEELKTIIKKDYDGQWSGRTVRTEDGITYTISTYKMTDKVVTIARETKVSKGGGFISSDFGMILDEPFLKVEHGDFKRVTEKIIKENHFKGLAIFDEKVNSLDHKIDLEKKYIPKVGDILFLEGYGKSQGSENNSDIIYKIEGDEYFTIEKDTLELNSHSRIRDIKKVFGIGTYFSEGYNMEKFNISQNILNDMLIDALEVKKANEVKKEHERKAAAEEATKKGEYLSQFKVADRRTTTKILKAHILNTFKTVQKVSVKSEIYSGGSSMRVNYFAPDKIEELESLIKSFQYGHFNSMEDIYESSGNEELIISGHIMETYKYVFSNFEEVEAVEIKEVKKEDFTTSGNENISIEKYSEKAGIIYGDTKPFKELLKSLKCRFNARLTVNDKKIAGWVFPLSKMEEVKKAFNI